MARRRNWFGRPDQSLITNAPRGQAPNFRLDVRAHLNFNRIHSAAVMTAAAKLEQLGIVLPPPPRGVAAYESWVRTGQLILTSGQLPWRDGSIAFAGRLGAEVSDEQGYQAARLCAINALAQLQEAAGDLEWIARLVKVDGYVHAAPGFRGHPQVLNGASDLFNEVFGPRGLHARLAIGVNEMPLDAAVQISVMAEVKI